MAVQNNGGDFQDYQSAQNQLLNIRAQQEQNLNEQRVMAQSDASTNNVLYQAAGLMADNTNTETAANFNPQTQAVLNQYGLGQPRIQKSSSSQNSTQQVSKQNIVINNNYKTENTTTNNVTVPSGGPIQGRPVTIGDNGIGKFKVWLNTTFAQQQEAAAKRDREYEIRQANLSKDSNKLMRKLEMVGTNVGKALDPRRISQATSDPMKMLFTTLGIVTIAKSWPRIMEFVAKADNFFNGGKLTELLGGKEGETPGKALKELLIGDDGLLGGIKLFLEKEKNIRKEALRTIPKPKSFSENFQNHSHGIIGIIKTFNDTVKSYLSYATNVAKVSIDPESVKANKGDVQKAAEQDIKTQTSRELKNYNEKNNSIKEKQEVAIIDKDGNKYTNWNPSTWERQLSSEPISGTVSKEITAKPNAGDRNVLLTNEHGTPVYKGLPEYSTTEKGNLIPTVGAQIAAGQEMVRLLNRAKKNKKEATNSAAIVQQLSKLSKVLNKKDEIIVSDYFKNFFEENFDIKDFAEKYDKKNLLYAIDPKTNSIILIDKSQRDLFDNILVASPNDEGQNLYRVTKDGFSKIIKALTGDWGGTDIDLSDIKNTNYTVQQKVNNKLLGSGYNVYAHYVLPETENISKYNDIVGYELAKDQINYDYKQQRKENLGRLNDFGTIEKEQQSESESKSLPNTDTSTKKSTQKTNLEPYEDRVKKALNFFMNDEELGLTEDQAKALVANLMAESSLKPKPHENDNFNTPEGIAQWLHKGRKKKLLELFNKKYGTTYESISEMSLDDQLKLVKLELLEGEYKSFLNNLKNNSFKETPIDSVDAFARGYELGGGGGQLASKEKCSDENGDYNKHYSIRKGHYNYLTNLLNQQESTQIASTITPQNTTPKSTPEKISTTAYNFKTNTADFQNISIPEKTTTQDYIVERLDKLYAGLDTINQNMAVINANMIKGDEKNVQATLSSSSSPNMQQEQQWTTA